MRIEAGKYYRTRDGRKVGPMVLKQSGRFHSAQSDSQLRGGVWEPNGDAWLPGAEDSPKLIAEWTDTPQGPVRTKTVTEIIPGLYSGVKVNDPTQFPATPNHVHVSMFGYLDATELRTAALVLTQLAEALEE